jgi:hypothetical protein
LGFLSAVGALLQGKEGDDLAEVKSLLLQVDQALGSSQYLLMGTLAGTNVFLLLSIPVGAEDETEAEPSVKINQKPYQKEENEVRSPEEFH